MSSHQLTCGYIIPAWEKALRESDKLSKDQIASLFSYLSSFKVEATYASSLHGPKTDPVLQVFHNVLTRGCPTFLPWEVEAKMVEMLGGLKRSDKLGSLEHELAEGEKSTLRNYWQALHIIEPRLKREELVDGYRQSWEELDSSCEEEFWFDRIPLGLSDKEPQPFFTQLFEPQRSLTSMVRKVPSTLESNFHDQRADFVLEFPYQTDKISARGVCIEVDGPHHQQAGQQYLDRQRDDLIHHSKWLRTWRFPTHELDGPGMLRRFAQLREKIGKHPFLHYVAQNAADPLYLSPEGRTALQYALTPFGVARLQLILLRAIMAEVFSLDAAEWKVAVLERDVPCAHLAIEHFRAFLSHLFLLEGKGRLVPEIQLTVYVTPEFEACDLHKGHDIRPLSELDQDGERYDLFIDLGVLLRGTRLKSLQTMSTDHLVTIRSAYHPHTPSPVMCGQRINWRDVWDPETKSAQPVAEEALTYFLRQVFRKAAFRVGQLPILHHALQNRTVIGLLPTGGGKSLTYQIASLLQPGLTLVVDPIKSLMKDQVDSLKRNGINRTVFVNSSLSHQEKEDALDLFQEGQAQLCFISPERMQMEDFRERLNALHEAGLYFAYAVIDEVHCVSEWGHDFRTSYLFLGANLLAHCRSYKGNVPLFGLTATASFDVLADVQRELGGNDPRHEIPDEQIVRHETTNRDEIQFWIDEVNISDETLDDILGVNRTKGSPQKVNEALGQAKHVRIAWWMDQMGPALAQFGQDADSVISQELIELTYDGENKPTPENIFRNLRLEEWSQPFWRNDGSNAGIIFAPHRSWYFGVTDKYKKPERGAGIYDMLHKVKPSIRKGTYLGAEQDEEGMALKIDQDNFDHQEAFLSRDLDLMICTKAFGMGIDKPNIRFTLHQSYPGSIESFVQEAGRAGRDRKLALSVILYNKQTFDFYGEKVEPDFDIQAFFHENSFRGVAKEYTVLDELLTWVSWPKDTHEKGGEEGIEKRLAHREEGESFTQVIPFYNLKVDLLQPGVIAQVQQFLVKLDTSINIYVVESYLKKLKLKNEEITAQTLLKEVNAHKGWPLHGWKAKVAEVATRENTSADKLLYQLDLLFSRNRNKGDTEKALYRLSLIGVIDTYTVDYNQGQFTITCTRKSEAQYLEHFRHYLNKFFPTRKVDQAVEELSQRSEPSLIRKMLGHLLEFAYNQIARKRREGIHTMKELCEIGLKYADRGQANLEMKSFLHLYFNSKYARRDYLLVLDDEETVATYRSLQVQQARLQQEGATYNLSLQDWTDGGKEANIDWVFDFMQIVLDDYQNTPLENLKHLRGATTRLLILNPENYTCRLLRAFTNAVLAERLPDHASLPEESILADIKTGVEELVKDVSSRQVLMTHMTDYLEKTLSQLDENKPTYHEFVANVWEQAMLFTHLAWTKIFAKQYAQLVQSITPQ